MKSVTPDIDSRRLKFSWYQDLPHHNVIEKKWDAFESTVSPQKEKNYSRIQFEARM